MSDKHSILVIEDNTEVRENLEEILELYGYRVVTAEDGTDGVEKALSDPPDLILCDVMMPRLDGFGVLNILSKKSATAGVPFVFLTAKAEKSDFRRGMNLGADDYVTKPFYKDELLSVIETRLQKSAALRQKATPQAGIKAFIDEAKGLATLKEMTLDSDKRHLKKREMLYQEGDYPRYLYYIESGKIKLYKSNEYGKDYIIDVLEAGSFLGYVDLIKGQPYLDSAAAMDDVALRLIPRDDFNQLLYRDRDVSSQLIKMLARNISTKEEQLLNLAYDSVRKRVADALLRLSDRQPEAPIEILRDDLAQIVGTAKESVIRMLSEFKQDGYIDIKNGVVFIQDRDRLSNFMG